MVTSIDSAAAAVRLAAEVADPTRTHHVVAVAVPEFSATQGLDLDELKSALPSGVRVFLVVGVEASWQLKRSLPPGLDVYGTALRLWRPARHGLAAADHPLLVLGEGLPPAVRIASWVVERLHVEPAPATAVARAQDEQLAVVTDVDDDAARVRLADGDVAVLPAAAVAGVAAPATRLVRVAQTLRVRVTSRGPEGPAQVSAVAFAPEPRARLEEQCPAGSTVRGRVTALRNYGALVSLLPGVTGLLHVGEVAPGWVRHVEDHLSVGELVNVRVLGYDGERVLLSRLGTAADPLTPALLPDGPAWLASDEPGALPAITPLAAEPAPGRGFGDDPVADAAAPTLGEQVLLLDDAVNRGREAHHELGLAVGDVHQQLAALRAEASRLVHDLNRDLSEARQRVATTLAVEGRDLVGSTQEALGAARTEVARLRRELDAMAEHTAELTAQLRSATTRAERADRRAEEQRQQALRHRGTAAALRAELDRYVPESQRLVDAVRASWARSTTRDDRARYPWQDPVLGPGFLPSLHRIEGVSLERVYDVCADVVSGRARDRPGLAVHPLRATDESGSPQRERADGAKAFRASLQVRTAAARRLHYWELPDGRVELAKIGYHDDFTI